MIIDFNRYNGGGGSGSGVTPQEVQAQIDSALTPYWESGETKDYVDEAVSGISLDGYYTSAETDSAISQAVAPFYTSAQTEDAIALAVAPFYTSAQTEEAITNKNYVTSAQTEEQILSKNYVTSGQVETQITDKNYITAQALTAYTPTSGFATVNGSAITEGGNIVIQGGGGSTEDIELPIAAAVNDLKTNIEARLDQKYYTKQEVNDIAARKVEAGQINDQIKDYVDPAIAEVNDNIEDKELATSAALNELNSTTVKSTSVKNIWSGSQSDYDDIVEKDPETLYIINNNQ